MESASSTSTPSLGAMKASSKQEISPQQAARFTLPTERTDSCITRTEVVDEVSGDRLDAFILDGVLSSDECNSLIAEAEDTGFSFWLEGTDTAQQERRDFRNADTIEVKNYELSKQLWKRIAPHLSDHERELEVLEEMTRWERDIEGVWEASSTNDEILLSRYMSGGHFAPHTDGYSVRDLNHRSMYSIILYLNCSPGGGTRFYQDGARGHLVRDALGRFTADDALAVATVQAQAGRALIFYHNIMHEGRPPNDGHQKYIVRSDVMYHRRDPICTKPEDIEAYELYRQAVELAGDSKESEALPLFRRAFRISPALADVYGM